MIRTVLILLALTLYGCAQYEHAYQQEPGQHIGDAQERITRQRLIKRQLLVADPLERATEQALNNDQRVASARVAFLIADLSCGSSGLVMGHDFTFVAAGTTHEPATDEEVRQFVIDALRVSGLTANHLDVTVHGHEWAISWGLVNRIEKENPDLSILQQQ